MSRPVPALVLAAVAALSPAAALARDSGSDGCSIRVDGPEGIARSGDVEVRPGDPERDVVAIGGSVRVTSGATARDVVAIGGSVIVEKGGVVRGNASALGGELRAEKGARIDGDASAVGGRLEAPAGVVHGKRSSVHVEVDGQPLAARIAKEIRAGMRGHHCDVQVKDDDD